MCDKAEKGKVEGRVGTGITARRSGAVAVKDELRHGGCWQRR